jgi:cellulose synthase/poly-beta-1,6-N-acetylglucosamine synthase-like glycosyltransferase
VSAANAKLEGSVRVSYMARGFPSISIIIPSFNQSEFLTRALDSLAQQEYPRLEVTVVDGGAELRRSRADVLTRWVSGSDRAHRPALKRGLTW